MIIIRDRDTKLEKAEWIIQKLSLNNGTLLILDEQNDPLSDVHDDCVIFITSMPVGCLRYQRDFFEKHLNRIPLWCVLLLNDDEIVLDNMNFFFHSDGLRRQAFSATPDSDWRLLRERVLKLTKIRPHKILVYSIRPHSGKRSLIQLLAEDLPNCEFQSLEENVQNDGLEATDAGQIIIVGRTLQELGSVRLPAGVEPYYALTMSDLHVQAYLSQTQLPKKLMAYGNLPLTWTEAITQQHLFCISPLYEFWNRTNTNPRLDERFVIWDRFGLPCPAREYTEENIGRFLSQFIQGRELSKVLQRMA